MKLRRIFFSLAVVALLSGCTDGPPDTHTPDLTFANLQPVALDVAKIEVKNNYKPPMQDPNVEHKFPVPPYIAAETLLKKQLVAGGRDNVLHAYIDDASVVREELPITKGIIDTFTRMPAERLNAKVLVRFEMTSPAAPDIVIGHAEVLAKRTKTLLEDTSPADRDSAYFSLTEDLMDDVNDGLKSIVKNTFGTK
jgi:hypothetical protein